MSDLKQMIGALCTQNAQLKDEIAQLKKTRVDPLDVNNPHSFVHCSSRNHGGSTADGKGYYPTGDDNHHTFHDECLEEDIWNYVDGEVRKSVCKRS